MVPLTISAISLLLLMFCSEIWSHAHGGECSLTCPVITDPEEHQLCAAISTESRTFESRCTLQMENCVRRGREWFQKIGDGHCNQHTSDNSGEYKHVYHYHRRQGGYEDPPTNTYVVECEESRDGCGCSDLDYQVCAEGPSKEHVIFPNICQMNCVSRCYEGDKGYTVIDCKSLRETF